MPEQINRKIRNAQVRYGARIEGLSTRAHIYDKSEHVERQPKRQRVNEAGINKPRNTAQRMAALAGLLKGIGQERIEYTEGDAALLIENPPVNPPFPIFMLGIAALKDVLDVPLDLSIIGIVATTGLSFTIALVLFFWLWGKMSGGWWKKKMVVWLWKRYILAIAIEFVPILKIIPATTILVLMAHFREKKIVQALDTALEHLRRVVS